MIGGIEIELLAPANEAIPDLIVRQMAEFWPASVFQDANSSEGHPISDPWVAIVGTNSREFFVFRDREAATKWEEAGAVAANSNTMLHFLVGDPSQAKFPTQHVTIVCDEETTEVMSLISDLKNALRSPTFKSLAA